MRGSSKGGQEKVSKKQFFRQSRLPPNCLWISPDYRRIIGLSAEYPRDNRRYWCVFGPARGIKILASAHYGQIPGIRFFRKQPQSAMPRRLEGPLRPIRTSWIDWCRFWSPRTSPWWFNRPFTENRAHLRST